MRITVVRRRTARARIARCRQRHRRLHESITARIHDARLPDQFFFDDKRVEADQIQPIIERLQRELKEMDKTSA